MRFVLAAVSAALLLSCGYTGEPLPPALNIPQPVASLQARQAGRKIKVDFFISKLTTDGIALRRIGEVEMKVNGESIEVTADEPGPVNIEIPLEKYAGQHVQIVVRVASVKRKWSTPVTKELDAIAALEPPGEPKVESHPQGVRISWQTKGAQTKIFRQGKEAARADGGEWIDTEAKYGEPQEYQLQTIQQEAESEPTAVLKITPEDIFPPSVPANLAAVQGINSVELTWDRSPEADTAGYRVYRADGGGELKRLGDQVVAASFSDRAVKSGDTYRYAVTSVDQKTNESPKSAVIEIAAP